MDRLSHALNFQHTTLGKELISASLDRSRAQGRKNSRQRLKNPYFREKAILHGRIGYYLFKLLSNKRTPFGCSSHELKAHFEIQFRQGMTWDNHGLHWEIDHVVPVSRFGPRELLSAFHYTNLRPRLAHLNRIDGLNIMRMRGVLS